MTRTTSPWLKRIAPIAGVTAIVAALLTPTAAVAEQAGPAVSDSANPALESLVSAYDELLPLIKAGETSGSTQPVAADTSSKRASRRDISTGITGSAYLEETTDPIVNAAIYLYPADDSSGYIATTTTNDDGEFTLAAAPGYYKLYIVPATGSTAAPQWFGGAAIQSEALEIEVLADAPRIVLDIELYEGATIEGRVTGEDLTAPKNGLANMVVLVAVENGGAEYIETDANGNFGIAGVPEVPLIMIAVDPNEPTKYQVQLWEDSTDFTNLKTFTLEPGELATRNFDLHVGSTLEGFISGSDTPTVGLADVEIATTAILFNSAKTDEDGRYFLGGIIPGEYQIGFYPPNSDDYQMQYWKNAATEEAATPLVFGDRQALTANVELVPTKSAVAGSPTITGTPTSGSTLTAVPGTWTPSSVNLSYQWFADSAAIAGATHSTLKLSNGTAGKRISVTVTGKQATYNSASATSAKTAVVDGGIFSVATAKIIGNPAIGKTLRVDRGYWGTSTATYTYSWKRSGKSISGATGTTYKVTKADAGKKLTVAVTARATGFVTAAVSTPARTIGKPLVATPNPKVTGTHKVGKKLTAKTGNWKPAGVKFSYRWLRDGKTIDGATGSRYKLKSADKGHRVSVVLTGSKSGYTSVSNWSASKKVK